MSTTRSEAQVGAGIPAEGMAGHVARVAARLFAERGYDATSVREIVEAAGVTKPTLYYHFGSKEGLAQALLTVPMDRLVGELRRQVEAEPDPRAAVEAMIETTCAWCRDDPDRARFVYALFFGPLGSGLAAELGKSSACLDVVYEAATARLVAAGVVAPDRAGTFTAALRGLITVHTMDYLYRGAPLGPGLGRRWVDDLLQGFGVTDRGRG